MDPVAALRKLKKSFGLDPKKPWPRLTQIGRDPANWPEMLGISRVQALQLQMYLVPPDQIDLPEALEAERIIAGRETKKRKEASLRRQRQECSKCQEPGHNARRCQNKRKTRVRDDEEVMPQDNRSYWRPLATIMVEYIRALMPEGASVLQCFHHGKACDMTSRVIRNVLAWSYAEGLLVFNYTKCVWRTAK